MHKASDEDEEAKTRQLFYLAMPLRNNLNLLMLREEYICIYLITNLFEKLQAAMKGGFIDWFEQENIDYMDSIIQTSILSFLKEVKNGPSAPNSLATAGL